jgi:hypothetical protein
MCVQNLPGVDPQSEAVRNAMGAIKVRYRFFYLRDNGHLSFVLSFIAEQFSLGFSL